MGAIPTITLIALTGIAGAYLAKTQGIEVLNKIQMEIASGKVQTQQLFDGVAILAGGILLLTPGFCTDILGFCLLIPFTRKFFTKAILFWMKKLEERGKLKGHHS